MEVGPGQVHRLRNNDKTAIRLFLNLDQYLFQYIQIQLIDQAGIFQHRNEIRRRQDAPLRIDPAGQCFFITDKSADCPDDRLVPDLDPSVLNRFIKMFQNVVALCDAFTHFFRIVFIGRDIRSLQFIPGKHCTVKGGTDRCIFIAALIDADMDRQGFQTVPFLPLIKQMLKNSFNTLVFHKCRKMTLPEMTAAVLMENPLQQLCKHDQKPVAFREPIFLVVVFETDQIHIQQNGISSFFPEVGSRSGCQFKEVVHVRKTGQIIIVIGFQDTLSIQRIPHRRIQFDSFRSVLFGIGTFVHVPDMRNYGIVFGFDAPADGVDDPVPGMGSPSRAIDHLIGSAVDKALHRLFDSCNIIRMKVPIEILVEIPIRIFTVCVIKQLTETIGKQERNNPSVQILINGNRLRE